MSTPDEPTARDGPSSPDEQPDIDAALAENARLKEELEVARGKDRERRGRVWLRTRRILAVVLVVLTSLSVLAATVSVWVHATVFQTARFVALVEPALDDPTVTNALADRVSNQIFEGLDLKDRVTAALPPPLDAVAVPVVTAAQSYVRGKVREVFASSRIHALLIQTLTVAHQKVIALLRGDYSQLPNVVVQNGEVQINLLPVIAEVLRTIAQDAAGLFGLSITIPSLPAGMDPQEALGRLSQALGRSLPPDFGQITVMSTTQLASLQDAVNQFDRLVWLAILLALVLIAVTLLLSTNRRRTLVQLGVGVVAALLVAGVAIRRIQDAVVERISNPSGQTAAKDVMASVLSNLRSITIWVAVVAAVVAIASYLFGRPRWFMRAVDWTRDRLRRADGGSDLERWTAAHADLLRFVGIALAVVILLIVGVGWWSFLVVGALLALFLWGVQAARRRIDAASAPAEPAEPEGSEPAVP